MEFSIDMITRQPILKPNLRILIRIYAEKTEKKKNFEKFSCENLRADFGKPEWGTQEMS